MHLVVQFAWKEKWPGVQFYTNQWAVASGLDGWSEAWKEHDWKVGDKEVLLTKIFGKEVMWTGLSE